MDDLLNRLEQESRSHHVDEPSQNSPVNCGPNSVLAGATNVYVFGSTFNNIAGQTGDVNVALVQQRDELLHELKVARAITCILSMQLVVLF
ncbi:hypothetical protein M413DRAFT_30441 [Hebeloma cylindrosporum]|uniref:Uncharacterized protein n=1 Tax=Hebeloma cylindrosporum TaxID=76867 RepID=A0A0C3BMW6_HEBCY|nr:hypothetical protein M413DRAFT_30441 [Hebeloma cylindrosporum h7]